MFAEKFRQTSNCLQVYEYICNSCEKNLLTDSREPITECSCGGSFEAIGAMVINRGACNHNYQQHGHLYEPKQ